MRSCFFLKQELLQLDEERAALVHVAGIIAAGSQEPVNKAAAVPAWLCCVGLKMSTQVVLEHEPSRRFPPASSVAASKSPLHPDESFELEPVCKSRKLGAAEGCANAVSAHGGGAVVVGGEGPAAVVRDEGPAQARHRERPPCSAEGARMW